MSENIDRNVFCTVIEDEGSLRRHLAELEQILDMIPALITVLSPGGKLLYVNKAVLRYTGLHIDDLKSNDARMRMFHPEDVERLKDIRQSGLGQGSPFELEFRDLSQPRILGFAPTEGPSRGGSILMIALISFAKAFDGGDLDVACITPGSAPGVSDDVVILAVLGTVANGGNGMVKVIATLG